MSLTIQNVRRNSLKLNKQSSSNEKLMLMENFRFISNCLPDFIPITKHASNIIDAANINLITMHLPVLVKMREWRLLFSIDRDGTSM